MRSNGHYSSSDWNDGHQRLDDDRSPGPSHFRNSRSRHDRYGRRSNRYFLDRDKGSRCARVSDRDDEEGASKDGFYIEGWLLRTQRGEQWYDGVVAVFSRENQEHCLSLPGPGSGARHS
ncbi:hypothetical protein AMTR_s00037p00226000 [Amborella trichopoda]|uniref:Uncharacterized protein n=1 Tax=Amborella trichopoda TaxID=13333 RepID=U5D7M5_AMBTC|nr:hypothetical protein AMTR_s00037p00226000 [Amborella trichopoda]